MTSLTFEQIIGGIIAVVVAGMPAVIAILKIRELHIAVNSQLSAMILATKTQTEERITATKDQAEQQITATKDQAEQRITATKQESDYHIADLKKEMEGVRHRNEQLLDQLAEAMKRLPINEAMRTNS